MKIEVGKKADGSPQYAITFAKADGSPTDDYLGAVLMTGPISGVVVLRDGTAYDVTDDHITIRPEHAGPMVHHIHRLLIAAGHDVPAHVCDEECGDEATSITGE